MKSTALKATVRCMFLLILTILPAALLAEENSATPDNSVALDEYSYRRAFLVFRPVVYAEKIEDASMPEGQPRSPAPPAEWTNPGFDDSRWTRTCGPLFPGKARKGWGTMRGGGGSREVSLICLRSLFNVPDPSKVSSLRLSVSYRGGIVAYLNGVEVTRGHVKNGPLTPDTPAEPYPWEAYVETDGKSPLEFSRRGLSQETLRRLNSRLRRPDPISLPVNRLKQGVNALALELHRAPTRPEAEKLKKRNKYAWSTVGLQELGLTATPAGSVEPNTRRPSGIQVWNEDPLADVYDLDYGDPNEPLRPIELTGVCNGSFSGQVVVGSDAPIKSLVARIGNLVSRTGGAPVPASAIRIAYPIPDGKGGQHGRTHRGVGSRPRFDGLAESPPAEISLAKIKPMKGYSGPLPVPGAVQPVRVTVDMPADTAAGDYEGMLSLEAEGMDAVSVPVKLTVLGWTLPDACDFTSVLGVVQSIDSLAVRYDAPLWSDRHWQLIDRSFRLLGRAGTDVLFLPLVMRNHHGREALVRWAPSGDGTYTHDFALFEKYVDTALKHIKRPEVAILYVWDRGYRCRPSHRAKNKDAFKLPPVIVPLLDPRPAR